MQCEAKKWADEFNKEGVPKRVDFLEAYLIQVMYRMSHVHITRHTSLQLVERPGKPLAAVEKFTEGE